MEFIPYEQLPPDVQAAFGPPTPSVTPEAAPAAPAAAPGGPEILDPVDVLDTPGLVKMAVDNPDTFSPAIHARANKDRYQDDPAYREKLNQFQKAIKVRGFELEDIDVVKGGKALAHMGTGLVKWGKNVTESILGATGSAPRSKVGKIFGYGAIAPIVRKIENIAGVAPETPQDVEERFKEAATKSAEAVSSAEAGASGTIEMVKTGSKKLWEMLPGTRTPEDWTSEEAEADLLKDLSKLEESEAIMAGKGEATDALIGGAIRDLGIEVDPEKVAQLSDPITFFAIPGGFALAGKIAGKTVQLSTAPLRHSQAVQAVNALNAARAAAAHTARQARVAAAEANALSPELLAGASKAQPALGTPIVGKAVRTAMAADLALSNVAKAEAAVAKLSPVQRAIGNLPAQASAVQQKVAEGLATAGAKVDRGIEMGVGAGIAGAGYGLQSLNLLSKLPRIVRIPLPKNLGKGMTEAGKSLATEGTGTWSPWAQLAGSVAKGGVDVGIGAGKGLLFGDIPFAALTSESPGDTANFPMFGGAMGAGAGLKRGAQQGILAQSKTQFTPEVSMQIAKAPGSFSYLNTATEAAASQAKPEQVRRFAALRIAAQAMGAELYWASPVKGNDGRSPYREALETLMPGQTKEYYDQSERSPGVKIELPLPNPANPAKPLKRTVLLVNEPGTARHEYSHAVQTFLGDAAMERVRELTFDHYKDQWDQRGQAYVKRFIGDKLTEYYLKGESWREAILDIELPQWREKAKETPAGLLEIFAKSDNYLNDELSAEVLDFVIKNQGPELAQNKGLPGVLARTLAKTMEAFGTEAFPAGTQSEGQGAPLTFRGVEQIGGAFREAQAGKKVDVVAEGIRTAREKAGGKPPVPSVQPKGGTPEAAADKAVNWVDKNATTEKDRLRAEAVKEILAAMREGRPVQLGHWAVPGTTGGNKLSVREDRRAEIEAGRNLTPEEKELVARDYWPTGVTVTEKSGPQFDGWSADNFTANLGKLDAWLKAVSHLSPEVAKDLQPYLAEYGIDLTKGISPEQWNAILTDAQTFSRNQLAGFTGSGLPIKFPEAKDVPFSLAGYTEPALSGAAAIPLNQQRADLINYLFFSKLAGGPGKAPVIRKAEKVPLNIAGQEIARATAKEAGMDVKARVSTPVKPRKPYGEGTEGTREHAAALRIEKESPQEVNPFRKVVEGISDKAKIKPPSLIEVSQKLNFKDIASFEGSPKIPDVRAVTPTLAAGFQAPREKIGGQFQTPPPEKRNLEHIVAAAIRLPTGEIYPGLVHGMAYDIAGISPVAENRPIALQAIEEGFVTSKQRFVGRQEAYEIGKKAQQYSDDSKAGDTGRFLSTGDKPVLESFAFNESRQFQAPLAEDIAAVRSSTNLKEDFKNDITGFADKMATKVKGVADLAALTAAQNFHKDAYQAARAAGDTNLASVEATKAQMFREAAQSAAVKDPVAQFQVPKDKKKEHVTEAAIRFDDGKVFTGPSHYDAIMKGQEFYDSKGIKFNDQPQPVEEGWNTSQRDIISREEAYEVAVKAGQIKAGSQHKWAKEQGLDDISPDDARWLESTAFNQTRKFQAPEETLPLTHPEKEPLKFDPETIKGGKISTPASSYKEAVTTGTNPYVRRSANAPDSTVPDNSKRQLMVQFASDLIYGAGKDIATGQDPMAGSYYDKLYSGTRKGYARLNDFWEIPQWMGFGAHLFPNADVYVVRDMAQAKQFLKEAGYDRVLMSALDVNKSLVSDLIDGYTGKVDIGGYVKPEEVVKSPNVTWHKNFESLAKAAGVEYRNGVDYRHFAGSDVIPRLTMSTGCKHKCAFCSVEKDLIPTPNAVVEQQANAIAELGSKLVYLNDKTFGQASNYRHLERVNEIIKEKVPDFGGFVVQTTAAQMQKMPVDWLVKSGIRFVELGIETYNDPILKEMRKPATESLMDRAADKLREAGIAMIPNIIIGFPQETPQTYARTLDWLKKNADNISHANIYNLAIYKEAELGKTLKLGDTEADFNENVLEKSWMTDPQTHRTFAGELYGLASSLLEGQPESVKFQAPEPPANVGKISEMKELWEETPRTEKVTKAGAAADLTDQVAPETARASAALAARGAFQAPERERSQMEPSDATQRESKFAAPPKTDDKKNFKIKPATISKAWILPNGQPVQLGGQWHHEWLAANSEEAVKRWWLSNKVLKKGDQQEMREEALRKGFARVNLEADSGNITFELRMDDLRKHKAAIADFVEANASAIDNINVSLFNPDVSGVLMEDSAAVFRLDDKAKVDNIPFVTKFQAPKKEPREDGMLGLESTEPAKTREQLREESFKPTVPTSIFGKMTQQEKAAHFPEAVIPKSKSAKLDLNIKDAPLYKEAKDEAEAIKLYADRLVEFAKEYQNEPEYAAGAKWYDELVPVLKRHYGKDARIMAELLAATSPQTNPQVNFGYAHDALMSYKSGRFDRQIKKFNEGLEKVANGTWEPIYKKALAAGEIPKPPQKPTGDSFMGYWIAKHDLAPTSPHGVKYGISSDAVLQVAARVWLKNNEGPKTDNFVKNMIGESDEATIDVWAARTMRWAGWDGKGVERWRIMPENSGGLSNPDFYFSQKVFRQAAERLNMKPSQLQGALWFAEKLRWARNGWSKLNLGSYTHEIETRLPAVESRWKQRREQEIRQASGKKGTKRLEQLEILPK